MAKLEIPGPAAVVWRLCCSMLRKCVRVLCTERVSSAGGGGCFAAVRFGGVAGRMPSAIGMPLPPWSVLALQTSGRKDVHAVLGSVFYDVLEGKDLVLCGWDLEALWCCGSAFVLGVQGRLSPACTLRMRGPSRTERLS